MLPILLLLVAVIAFIVGGPLLSIWALNTLFGLGIAFTFETWAAALWLSTVVGGSAYGSSKSSKS